MTRQHLETFVGRRIRIKLTTDPEGHKGYVGVLRIGGPAGYPPGPTINKNYYLEGARLTFKLSHVKALKLLGR